MDNDDDDDDDDDDNQQKSLISNIFVGTRLNFYWKKYKRYFPCKVTSLKDTYVNLLYDDGDKEKMGKG